MRKVSRGLSSCRFVGSHSPNSGMVPFYSLFYLTFKIFPSKLSLCCSYRGRCYWILCGGGWVLRKENHSGSHSSWWTQVSGPSLVCLGCCILKQCSSLFSKGMRPCVLVPSSMFIRFMIYGNDVCLYEAPLLCKANISLPDSALQVDYRPVTCNPIEQCPVYKVQISCAVS